jgi:hypothetical protein
MSISAVEQSPGEPGTAAHASGLQGWCSISAAAGQAAPPKAGWVVTVNDRLCPPPPHGASQAPQAPQLTSQSTAAHGSVLHS